MPKRKADISRGSISWVSFSTSGSSME